MIFLFRVSSETFDVHLVADSYTFTVLIFLFLTISWLPDIDYFPFQLFMYGIFGSVIARKR